MQDALDNMPAEVRSEIAEAAPRAYAKHAETVYCTRTPPFGSTLVKAA